MIFDTHCHIHDSEFYGESREQIYQQAIADEVGMICVGTNETSSQEAIQFAASHEQTWATVGVHPHDSKDGWGKLAGYIQAAHQSIVGIGEIGLDYFYDYSPRAVQIAALESQLQLAVDNKLPVSFHVREAYDDFWPIFDNFSGVTGVLHSFTDSWQQAERGLARGLYIGVNGISTFTKDPQQQAMFQQLPLEQVVLETDAPFLTPSPFRGKVNMPSMVVEVAKFQAAQRGTSVATIVAQTTANATRLFRLSSGEQRYDKSTRDKPDRPSVRRDGAS